MGDPKKPKKKFNAPGHPWQAERIQEEKVLLKEYGLSRKNEIWKVNSMLVNFKDQAKIATATLSKQGDLEGQLLLKKLRRLGLISETAVMDDVLGLGVKALLERRLQTILVRKQLALSMDQARQFIVHGHITVDGRKITSPSYIVSIEEEAKIGFAVKSSLADENHPEREKKQKPQPTEEEKAAKEKEKKSDRKRRPRAADRKPRMNNKKRK